MFPSSGASRDLPLFRLDVRETQDEARGRRSRSGVLKMRPTVLFYICFVLLLASGLACLVCVCTWNSKWRGGFAWNGLSPQFNWHPVLMVTGLVVLYGIGAVVYRVPLTWGQNKLPWKMLHAGLMLLSLILSIVGLCAVFDVHNHSKTPNLYSLHSWIGIIAVTVFAIQWVLGAATFLLPFSPPSLRRLLKPIHVWMGGSVLSLSIAACISGINEKLIFVTEYSKLPPEARFANALGLLIVVFGLAVFGILGNDQWKRPEPRLEELSYTPVLQEEHE